MKYKEEQQTKRMLNDTKCMPNTKEEGSNSGASEDLKAE